MSSDVAVDFDLVQHTKIVKYRFFTGRLVLHQSITLIIILFSESGDEIKRIEREVVGAEYEAWGLDDGYLEEIAASEVLKLQLPPVAVVEEPLVEIELVEVEPLVEEPISEEPV